MDPRQRLHMMDLLRRMAAEGRAILFSSHILEEVERLAEAVLVVYAGRLAASGDFRSIRRLMTDRPHTFTVRSSDDRPLAAALLADPAVFGAELLDGRLAVRTRRLRGLHADRRARRAGGRASACSRCRRPTTRSRACSATWSADERVPAPLVDVTLRGLLGRRRTLTDRPARRRCRCSSRCSIRIGGGRPDAPGSSTRWSSGRSAARRARLRDRGDRLRDRGRHAGLPAASSRSRAGGSPSPRRLVAAGLTAVLVVPADRAHRAPARRLGADRSATTLGLRASPPGRRDAPTRSRSSRSAPSPRGRCSSGWPTR